MRSQPTRLVISIAVLLLWANVSKAKETQEIPLFSFEEAALSEHITAESAAVSLVSDTGITHGKQAFAIDFEADVNASGVRFAAESPWDTRELGNCRFSFDATNPGEVSVHLYCEIRSANGGTSRRSVAVPAGSSDTYYFELKGDGLTEDRGLRDDPPSLRGVGQKMIVQGLKQNVNFDRVKSIRLYLEKQLVSKSLVIDHLRIVSNPPIQTDYLEALVDEFGQSAKVDYPLKVESEAELQQAANEELAALKAAGPMPDRSKFGGWKHGPKLKATGYFRTEKVGPKWALVDPEGYLYFSTGIANARMSNTATFTGVDFSDDSVRTVDPNEVTPEDSLGIEPTSAEARKSRVITSPMRHKMFNWLPDYDNPLAKYYGYRRSAHKGPMPHGEVFSFYLANLARRYGEPESGTVLDKWLDVTLDRMQNWGFTSFGNWADARFYHMDRVPYFANGWIIGDFKTLSGGYWGAMPDPFDPEFVRRAKSTVAVIGKEVRDNPWCIGVFIDNEKSWGKPGKVKDQYIIVLDALARDAESSPTKAAFMEVLKRKYGSIEALNEAWNTEIESWSALARGVDHTDMQHGTQLIADYSMLLKTYASEYFRVVHDALEEVLPNHLYLGPRFAAWGLTPEIWESARKYCDVIAYNFYKEGLGKKFWEFLGEIDMPSLIGEFHMGATDTGFFNPGIIHAADQKDRARMWKTYMESVIDNPYFVGAHWFQYIDSPITGRAHDGENYNIGFVTVTDIPYPPLIQAAKELNGNLYQRRYGDIDTDTDVE